MLSTNTELNSTSPWTVFTELGRCLKLEHYSRYGLRLSYCSTLELQAKISHKLSATPGCPSLLRTVYLLRATVLFCSTSFACTSLRQRGSGILAVDVTLLRLRILSYLPVHGRDTPRSCPRGLQRYHVVRCAMTLTAYCRFDP